MSTNQIHIKKIVQLWQAKMIDIGQASTEIMKVAFSTFFKRKLILYKIFTKYEMQDKTSI